MLKVMPYLISEKTLESLVVKLAKMTGWTVYHTWNAIHSPSGFPDLVLVKGRRMIWAELKSQRGKLRPSQKEWLNLLSFFAAGEDYEGHPVKGRGMTVCVWRPSDWLDDTIVKELQCED